MKEFIKIFLIICIGLLISSSLFAQDNGPINPDLDYAQVVYVRAVQGANYLWTFHVSVKHNDEGWEHYADLWEVVNPETGEVFGERILAHPHDTEQPFTRSQSNIEIPESILAVKVRARCNLHGFEGKKVIIKFTVMESDDYIIEFR